MQRIDCPISQTPAGFNRSTWKLLLPLQSICLIAMCKVSELTHCVELWSYFNTDSMVRVYITWSTSRTTTRLYEHRSLHNTSRQCTACWLVSTRYRPWWDGTIPGLLRRRGKRASFFAHLIQMVDNLVLNKIPPRCLLYVIWNWLIAVIMSMVRFFESRFTFPIHVFDWCLHSSSLLCDNKMLWLCIVYTLFV